MLRSLHNMFGGGEREQVTEFMQLSTSVVSPPAPLREHRRRALRRELAPVRRGTPVAVGRGLGGREREQVTEFIQIYTSVVSPPRAPARTSSARLP